MPPELLPRLLALPWTQISPDGSAKCIAERLGYERPETERPIDDPVTLLPRATTFGSASCELGQRPPDAESAVAAAEACYQRAVARVRQARTEHAKRQPEHKSKSVP